MLKKILVAHGGGAARGDGSGGVTFRLGVLLLCCTIGTGCTDRSEAAPIAAPSATDPAGNALRIASLVERQCSYRSEDVEAFGAGLRTTGWAFVRTQMASKANPLELDGWRAPYLQVFRGESLKDRVWKIGRASCRERVCHNV